MFASSKRISPRGRTVVVTGASSGLGRACALHLDRLGFQVFAGVRRTSDAEELAVASQSGALYPLMLDVTCEDSIGTAAEVVADAVDGKGLWGLVNNAGICVSAPLECVTPAQMRWQLETNLVGHLAVTQALLPQLRAARGRIVNVSSGLGRISSPFLGAYASSQFAKEGLSDALRRELKPTGVDVAVIQPGAINTPIWGKVSQVGQDVLSASSRDIADLYREPFLRFLEMNENRALTSSTRPENFSKAVTRALTAVRPRTRYSVGSDARATNLLARMLPDAVLDAGFDVVSRGRAKRVPSVG
ncbi:SDR family oxidoreductase [Streptomyces sp. NA02950]|uniref:SDR family oxidoreductase n=1 Tax=Streptomyces sp. NA02950 TaxID=2742137 RepID=UPI00159237CB|nr:SDR family oxidoreductase [Streptomyces sp. NA02950]QKV94603.1 SDR family oxidoreductase [Streptomyces sp. NA02950]